MWLTLVQFHVELLSRPKIMISVLFLPSFRDIPEKKSFVLVIIASKRSRSSSFFLSYANNYDIGRQFCSCKCLPKCLPISNMKATSRQHQTSNCLQNSYHSFIVKCKYKRLIGDMLLLPNLEAASSKNSCEFQTSFISATPIST